MNIQLKQRLIGAVVLVALAVIFIPMLLSGRGDLGGSIDGSNIPPEPDFRFPPVPTAPKAPLVAAAPVVPLGDDDEEEDVELPVVPDKPAPAKKRVKTPVPSIVEKTASAEPGQLNGWVVQVGSFSARNNARTLRDKLRKQGHASFVESIKGASGRVYRVRVGPELSKTAADKLRQRLAKESGLKGLVQVYP